MIHDELDSWIDRHGAKFPDWLKFAIAQPRVHDWLGPILGLSLESAAELRANVEPATVDGWKGRRFPTTNCCDHIGLIVRRG